jgi:C1A family cysteine protease
MTELERLSQLEAEVRAMREALTVRNILPRVGPAQPVPPHTPSSAVGAPVIHSAPQPVNIPSTPGKRNYKLWPDLPDQRDFVFSSLKFDQKIPKLATSVDLRSIQSPVEDQGNLGSCTANAFAGGLQCLEVKDKLPMVAMSRLFIYYNERALEGTVGSDAGASLRDGIKTLVAQGCCPETEWPYIITKFAIKPIPQCYTDGLKHTVQSYYRVQTLTDMKTCLASGFPFVFGITVYASFESANATATGIIPMPAKHEQVLGGHALLAVGYDDSKQWFIFKNSWGASWGNKGYGFIPYAYLTNTSLASDMWYISRAKAL